MDFSHFRKNFASLFEVTPNDNIQADTSYKDIEEWDSLMALETIAMTDEEYNVELNGDDIRDAGSVAELYEIIKSRMHG